MEPPGGSAANHVTHVNHASVLRYGIQRIVLPDIFLGSGAPVG